MLRAAVLTLLAGVALLSQNVDWIKQVQNKPLYDVRQYNWLYPSGQSASGNLSSSGAGKTVALTPCPAGLTFGNGTLSVYISAGVGSAEVATVTAKSTSGANCTITITTANTHTGAWRIGSATVGLKEASESLPLAEPSRGCVYLPAGLYQPRATVTGVGQPRFCGNDATIQPTFVNGDVFNFIYASGPSYTRTVFFDGIKVWLSAAATSGTVFNMEGYTDGIVRNLECNNAFTCIQFNANNTGGGNPVLYDNIRVHSNQGTGVLIKSLGTGQVAGTLSNIYVAGAPAITGTIGMQLSGLHAGWTASNIWMQHNTVSLDIVGVTANDAWIEATFNNMILDQDASVASPIANIRITGPGGAGQIANGLTISNSLMQTAVYGILATDVRNAKFINNTFSVRGITGMVVLDDCAEIDIAGNTFNIAGAAVPNAIVLQSANSNINIHGNTVTNSFGPYTLANFLDIEAAVISDVSVFSNFVRSTTTFITNASTAPAPANIKIGPNDFTWAVPGIASGTSIAMPDVENDSLITISGTTDISQITGYYAGREFRFRMQGILNFPTGGTAPGDIATAFGPTTAGQVVIGTFDVGTGKWSLK